MTTITVTNSSQLTSALNSAKAGDTISLASGNYGDVSISKAFASDVTITSANAGSPATFHSLSLNGASHLNIDGINVAFVPTAATLSFSPAVSITGSTDITFTHSVVTAGNAISGVAQSATSLDSTGNVIGMPTGYGITITNSNGVKVDSVDVSQVNKGIVLLNSSNLTISHNDIHDMRTSGIAGGGSGSHITIDSNHIHDSNPWHWGSGDHADYLALWTDPTQKAPSTDIKITNNLFEQGKGTAVLGMWMQGGDAGFTDVTISKNAFLMANNQGIVLWDVTGGSIDNNTMMQTSGADWKSAPAILLSGGSEKIAVHDNSAYSFWDTSGSTGSLANSMTNNHAIQTWDKNGAGYYTADQVKSTEAAFDAYAGVSGGSASTTTTTTTSSVGSSSSALSSSSANSTAAVTAPTVPVAPTPTPTPAPAPVATGDLVLNGNWDYTKLVGGSGNDVFNSKSGGDTLSGGSGNDTYYILSGKTQIIEAANGGVDTVVSRGDYTAHDNIENVTVSDTATNGWAATGNTLNNVITGNAGGNYLDGLSGNDTIDGKAGNDYIVGGLGADRLTGGAGKDTFVFDKASGQDTITDFSKADHDVIDVSAYLKAGYKAVLTDVGADVKISFATGDAIMLTGVHAKDLIATSYGFTI